jgi:hypothetical protein
VGGFTQAGFTEVIIMLSGGSMSPSTNPAHTAEMIAEKALPALRGSLPNQLPTRVGGSTALLPGPRVAQLGRATSPAAGSSSIGSGPAGPGSPDFTARLLRYAACMRKHGVPNFPDPSASRGFTIPMDRSSPAWGAAQATCRKLLPYGGPPGPDSATHPSAQALASMLRVSQCMRRHGIREFPDPGSRLPLHPPARSVITDMSGVIPVFPPTLVMNFRSPAFAQAEATCNFGPLGQGAAG